MANDVKRKISTLVVATDSSDVDRSSDYTPVLDMSETDGSVLRNKRMYLSRLTAEDSDFYNDLAEESSVSASDYIMIYTGEQGGYRKMTNDTFHTPGLSSGTHGWCIGGASGSGSDGAGPWDVGVNKLTFASDTFTSGVTTQVVGTGYPNCISDHGTNIYTFGGRSGNGFATEVNRCETTVIATGATATDSAFSLPVIQERGGCSKGTSSKGYILSGYQAGASVVNAIKCTYATSTAAFQASADVPVAQVDIQAVPSDGTTKALGHTGAGWIKIVFSTDTTSNVLATGYFDQIYTKGQGVKYGNTVVAYLGWGGNNVANAQGCQKIFFASECNAIVYNNDAAGASISLFTGAMTTSKGWRNSYGMSDGNTTGWNIGGWQSGTTKSDEISKLHFSNDTWTALGAVLPFTMAWGNACNDKAG